MEKGFVIEELEDTPKGYERKLEKNSESSGEGNITQNSKASLESSNSRHKIESSESSEGSEGPNVQFFCYTHDAGPFGKEYIFLPIRVGLMAVNQFEKAPQKQHVQGHEKPFGIGKAGVTQ